MQKRTVDSIAMAVVRQLKRRPRRKGPPGLSVASARPPRRRAPGPRAAVASATGPALGRGPGSSKALDALVGKLASMVGQRLAKQEAAKAGRHLATSRMTSNIIRGIGKQGADAPEPVAVQLGDVDPAAVAAAVSQALTQATAARSDPTAIVASSITSRLRHVRVMATMEDAKAFQDKVSGLVAEAMKASKEAAELEAAEVSLAGADAATAAAAVEGEAGSAKKRG